MSTMFTFLMPPIKDIYQLIMNTTNEMQLRVYRLIYYSLSALHVSGDVFAHHREHLTVFTASGNIHQCRCRLVSWMSWTSPETCRAD
jgi:hypothetical protein